MSKYCGHAAVIEHNGDIYSCDHFVFPEYRLGNIHDTPIINIMYSPDYARVGQHPYAADHILLPEIMKENGYNTALFGKWAGGYEGSHSTPDRRGVDEFYGYICQYQAHLYYPNF